MKTSMILRWLKRGRLVSAVSRSTGDLLKALNQQCNIHHHHNNNDQNGDRAIHNSHHDIFKRGAKHRALHRQPGVIKTGYLYVLADAGFWFRMWVVLRVGRLETYYEQTDTIPMGTVSLCGGILSTPRAISSECPEDILYPMHICKEGHPTVCLAAENADDHRRWTESIRGSLQASSLDMEGLNLEGHGIMTRNDQNEDLLESDRNLVFRKLELLDELLAQREDVAGAASGRVKELSQKLHGLEQCYERLLIAEQQEALRRTTHLRQRKISTQLKADKIREQLRTSRKQRPKSSMSFRENLREEGGAPTSFYEGQLRELTDQLSLIHSRLGREEAHSEVTSRKLHRKQHNEVHRLHSDMDVLCRKGLAPTPQLQSSRSHEDCRIDSRRNLLIPKNNKTVSMLELNSPPERTRRSPLRFLGHLVDVAHVRRKYQTASEELLPDRRDIEEGQEEISESREESCLGKGESDGSSSSSASSDRRRTEIDPSALAEIQAFEQLAEQVLGSRALSRSPSSAK